MRPAEIVAVAVAIPMIAALFVATYAEGRIPAASRAAAAAPIASSMPAAAANLAVVTAQRPARS